MPYRSHRFSVLAALAAAAALSGCADLDTGQQQWFAKPFDLSGRSAGYSFSELAETKKKQRPITAKDLVNANGSCPAPPVPAAAPPPAATAAATPSGAPPAGAPPGAPPAAPLGVSPDGTPSDPLLGSGIALGMSECEVVYRAGPPSSVQIGSLPNGDRSAALTFPGGPRPGIYRFVRGALTEMDAVAVPPQPQVAKKRPVKRRKSAQN